MGSSVNIALPVIQTEFRTSAVTLSWISLSYMLATGAVLLPAGRLADLYGRKRIFTWGLLAFAIVTFVCGLAPSAGILIALRIFQGVASALIFGIGAALVTLAYPVEIRGRALGLNVAGVYLGLTIGPVLGGIIVHSSRLGWRSLFFISGALGLLNWLIPIWRLRAVEWKEVKTAPFDIRGSVIYAVSLPLLLLGFSSLPGLLGVVLITAGVAGLTIFVWWETRAPDPLLHIDLLRHNRVFAYSNVAALINYAATYAVTFLLSLYLQYNRGLDPRSAGFVLVAATLVQTTFSPIAGRMADRVEARWVASAGMALCTLGLFALVFLGEATPYWYIMTVLCVLGLGFAFFSSPITHTVMGSVGRNYAGVASATLGTMRTAGQNMSQGIATLVLAVVVGRHVIGSADYPNLLVSIRISLAIFTALCALGVVASLVGPRRRENNRDATQSQAGDAVADRVAGSAQRAAAAADAGSASNGQREP